MALTGEVTRNDSLQKSLQMFEVLPSWKGLFFAFSPLLGQPEKLFAQLQSVESQQNQPEPPGH